MSEPQEGWDLDPDRVVVRDKRRLDESGRVRRPEEGATGSSGSSGSPSAGPDPQPTGRAAEVPTGAADPQPMAGLLVQRLVVRQLLAAGAAPLREQVDHHRPTKPGQPHVAPAAEARERHVGQAVACRWCRGHGAGRDAGLALEQPQRGGVHVDPRLPRLPRLPGRTAPIGLLATSAAVSVQP